MNKISEIDAVLDFWFGFPHDSEYGKPHLVWFSKDFQFDQRIRELFLETYERAILGEFESWKETSRGCLALCLVLDQFPRNLFRSTPKAFASDSLALTVAQWAIDSQFDRPLLPVQRWFLYLPFEHDESLASQNLSVQLFETLKDDPNSQLALKSAYRHREIIAQFGRFPHRNSILGRISTSEEIEFLKQPDSSF